MRQDGGSRRAGGRIRRLAAVGTEAIVRFGPEVLVELRLSPQPDGGCKAAAEPDEQSRASQVSSPHFEAAKVPVNTTSGRFFGFSSN